MKKLVCVIGVMLISMSFVFVGCVDRFLEKKIIWQGTIDDIVDNETILITIDKYYNSKKFTAKDFDMVNIVEDSFTWLSKTTYDNYIATKSLPDDFHHSILIKIVDNGKQNLIDAIRKLEKVKYVLSAEPNSFDTPNGI